MYIIYFNSLIYSKFEYIYNNNVKVVVVAVAIFTCYFSNQWAPQTECIPARQKKLFSLLYSQALNTNGWSQYHIWESGLKRENGSRETQTNENRFEVEDLNYRYPWLPEGGSSVADWQPAVELCLDARSRNGKSFSTSGPLWQTAPASSVVWSTATWRNTISFQEGEQQHLCSYASHGLRWA